MNRFAPLFVLAATLATAQTTPPTPAPKSSTGAIKPVVHHAAGTTGTSAVKLPPGVPPARGVVKSAFALRYQDVKIGTGPVAEPNKLYKVKYTGWLASDGKKFDSSEDHPNKEPIQFPQGRGRVIPGWDQGFEGMKIGGKRRLFIPYQLAYGVMGRPPVIPGKSDLIFDIDLVGVDDMPGPAGPGGMGSGMGRPRPTAPGSTPGSAPGTTSPSGTTPAPGAAPGAPATPAPPAGNKPADPTAPTVSPNSATPTAPAPSATPAPSTPGTPPPDKPANPAQPNPSN